MASETVQHARNTAVALGQVRVCTGPCGRVLPVSEFHWRHTPTDQEAGRQPRPNARCKDCMKAYGRERYAQMRREVIEMYGDACVACGDDRILALDLDHVNDDGSIERLTMNQDHNWLRFILNSPKRNDLQVLCGSCHAIKIRGGDPVAPGR